MTTFAIITQINRRGSYTINSVDELLKFVNESNHTYYLNDGRSICPITFEEDVEYYKQYKDCIWVGRDCGYMYSHGLVCKNINIDVVGENTHSGYTVLTVNKVVLPPIDKYIFDSYDELIEFLHSYDVNETPNYEGEFDYFCEKHHKSIDMSSVAIFLIKEN